MDGDPMRRGFGCGATVLVPWSSGTQLLNHCQHGGDLSEGCCGWAAIGRSQIKDWADVISCCAVGEVSISPMSLLAP